MSSRLNRETIHKILIAHSQGVKRSVIAKEHEIDSSTVSYHIEKFENTYGSSSAVYSLVRPVQRVCHHPSLKCLVCGAAQDHIHRRELEQIERLKVQVLALGGELDSGLL